MVPVPAQVRLEADPGHGVVVEGQPVVHDPAVPHHDRAVDQRRHRAELVGHQDDRGTALLEVAQRVGQGTLVGQVDPGVGLVEEEQLGPAGQRPGDEDALLLAAGEVRDAVAGAVGEPDHGQGVVDRRAVLPAQGTQEATPGQSAGGDHLPHRGGHPRGGRGALGHEADPVPVVEVGKRDAEELQRAPASGCSPVRARTRVDLPEPLAPISARNSPECTARSMPRSTGRPPRETAPPASRTGSVRRAGSRRPVSWLESFIGIRSPSRGTGGCGA